MGRTHDMSAADPADGHASRGATAERPSGRHLDHPRAPLVLRLRRSRQKARDAAAAELASMLRAFEAEPASGGPLSDVAGTAWVTVSMEDEEEIRTRVKRLGYSESVYLVTPATSNNTTPTVRWKGRDVE